MKIFVTFFKIVMFSISKLQKLEIIFMMFGEVSVRAAQKMYPFEWGDLLQLVLARLEKYFVVE